MKPRVFIGSSREGIPIANAIHTNLTRDAECTVWKSGVFQPSSFALNSLIDELDDSQFGIFVFSPDDTLIMRSEQHQVVRDNVLFELGLFIGRLGHKRCFFLVPESGGIRLPTDLFGLNSTEYESNRRDSNWVAAVNPACTSILQVMRDQTHLSEVDIAAPIIRAHIGASSEHVAPAGKEVTAKIKMEQYKKSFLLKSDDPVHRERLSALPYASYNRTLQGWVIPQFKGTLVRQDLADLL